MVIASSVFLVILAYGLLMKKLGIVTTQEPLKVKERALDLFTTAIPVAYLEEVVFRTGIFNLLLMGFFKLEFL